ncbi:hypothetical protein KA005_66755, partial [bacterium]|nr:hypothetical protein [bacterium]
IIKKRRLWILLVGIGLLILPRPILVGLLPSDNVGPYSTAFEIPPEVQMVSGLIAILCIVGIYLIIRYIIGDKYVVIPHTDGEVEFKLRNKKKREKFLKAINEVLRNYQKSEEEQ